MLVCGAFFVGVESKMRSRGTKSEAEAVIVNWGTLGQPKESSNIGLIEAFSAGSDYLRRFFFLFMLAGDARPGA